MSLCTDTRNMKFVFWPYDQFPFVLGAEAMPRPNDMWYIPSYQMTMKPLAVFDLDIGQGIAAELKNMAQERQSALHAINLGFRAQLAEIAPFAIKA